MSQFQKITLSSNPNDIAIAVEFSPENMPPDHRQLAEELSDYWREQAGDRVRAVVYFNVDEHDLLYMRDDVSKKLAMDDRTMSMFRLPAVQIVTAIRKLASASPNLNPPRHATINYDDVTALFLPKSRKEGILITVDTEGDILDSLISRTMEISEEFANKNQNPV